MLFEAEARKKPKLPLNSLAIIIKHTHIHIKEKKSTPIAGYTHGYISYTLLLFHSLLLFPLLLLLL